MRIIKFENMFFLIINKPKTNETKEDVFALTAPHLGYFFLGSTKIEIIQQTVLQQSGMVKLPADILAIESDVCM